MVNRSSMTHENILPSVANNKVVCNAAKGGGKVKDFARAVCTAALAALPPLGNKIAEHCKIVDFAIEPGINRKGEVYYGYDLPMVRRRQ